MKAARIVNGKVVDLWEVPSLDCYAGIYELVAAPDGCAVGDGYALGVFVPALPGPAVVAAARRVAIAAELLRLDADSIRALRAKAAGKGKPADDTRLLTLDARADALRVELAALGV